MKKILIILLLSAWYLYPQAKIDLLLKITDDSTGLSELSYGIDPLATDGIDLALGEEEYPPLPPTGVFDARFVGDDIGLMPLLGNGVHKDYRNGAIPFTGKKIHEIRYQPGKGTIIRITWDLPTGVTAVLKDLFGGAFINVNCSGKGNYVVTNWQGFNKLLYEVNYLNVNTAVNENVIPGSFGLFQNYPNPFNPSTTIKFTIPFSKKVTLKIFNSLGQEVETLINEIKNSGTYNIIWNASAYPGGVYYYELNTEGFRETKKMILVK